MKRLKDYLPLLSALLVGCMIYASLKGYVAPVYELLPLETAQAAQEEAPGEKRRAESETETEAVISQGSFDLEDGIYYGTATGYSGPVRVAVTIKDHTIVAIEILETSDDFAYMNLARAVIDRLLAAQSFDVDTVSGATYSSRGIIKAVKNALTGEVDDSAPAGEDAGKGAGSTSVSKVEESGNYKDGTYYGTGTGFSGRIRVKVVISGGKIASIEIVESSDDASYLNRAKTVIARILKKQSTNVDVVSGASYSSAGIITAVRDALRQAAAKGQPETETETETETEEVITGTMPYPDGVYTGTAEGYLDDITVNVTIKDKTMTAIDIVYQADDPAFFNRALDVIKAMLKKQTAEVDVVSGATYSSKGIIGAVKAALAAAEQAAHPETESQTETEEEKPVTGTIPYKDGFYEGTGHGQAGDITVSIVIKDHTMISVIVTDSGDSDELTYAARTCVIPRILKKQTADVQPAADARQTSEGIMEAVRNALAAAKAATEQTVADQPEPVHAGDGTYHVTVLCSPDEFDDFAPYHLSADITISGGRITAIDNVVGDGDEDNDRYVAWALDGRSRYPGIVSQITAGRLPDEVDTVSRATCSSNALIEACRMALEAAEKAGKQ